MALASARRRPSRASRKVQISHIGCATTAAISGAVRDLLQPVLAGAGDLAAAPPGTRTGDGLGAVAVDPPDVGLVAQQVAQRGGSPQPVVAGRGGIWSAANRSVARAVENRGHKASSRPCPLRERYNAAPRGAATTPSGRIELCNCARHTRSRPSPSLPRSYPAQTDPRWPDQHIRARSLKPLVTTTAGSGTRQDGARISQPIANQQGEAATRMAMICTDGSWLSHLFH